MMGKERTPMESARHHCLACSKLSTAGSMAERELKTQLFWLYSSISRYIAVQNLKRSGTDPSEIKELTKKCKECSSHGKNEKEIAEFYIHERTDRNYS